MRKDPVEGAWTFVAFSGHSSTTFVAMWSTTFAGWDHPVGFFEVGQGGDYSYSLDEFKATVRWYNPNGPVVTSASDGRVLVSYRRVSSGDPVTFQFSGDNRHYQIFDQYAVDQPD